jgi:serine/threonine protein kinase
MRRANRSRHSNVVRFFGLVTFNDNVVGVVMELLGESLDKATGCDLPTRMKYTRQIIAGMKHMHNDGRGVIHFDLKPANLLLTQDGSSVKIIDFSVSMTSTSLDNAGPGVRGTLPFIAPELFDEEPQLSMKCDLYSFAVVLAQLWTGAVPWEGRGSSGRIRSLVVSGRRPYSLQGLSKSGVPNPIIALIVACWAQEPKDRPTFAQLRELPTDFHLAQPEEWPHFLSTCVV